MFTKVVLSLTFALPACAPVWDISEPIYVEFVPNTDEPNIPDGPEYLEAMKWAIKQVGGTVSSVPGKQNFQIVNNDDGLCDPQGSAVAATMTFPYDYKVTICRSAIIDRHENPAQINRQATSLHELLHLLSNQRHHILDNQLAVMTPVNVSNIVLTDEDKNYLCDSGYVLNGICN